MLSLVSGCSTFTFGTSLNEKVIAVLNMQKRVLGYSEELHAEKNSERGKVMGAIVHRVAVKHN